jgi:hypothetical protein
MNQEPDIKRKILEKIGHGEVRKRSRVYFIAQIVVAVMLFVIALALSVFVLSFAIFSMHESGEQFLLGFGWQGIMTFISLFPWAFLIIDVLLFILIEWLSRRFKFGYRISVLRALFGILVLAIVGGVIINFTPLHATLLQMANHNELPVIGEWYEGIYASHAGQGVFRGTVSSIQGNEFIIFHDDKDHDADDGMWTVVAPAGFDMTSLSGGERVYVAGGTTSGVIQAYGIGQLSGDM